MRIGIAAAVLALTLGAGTAFAQTKPAAPTPAPAAAPAAPAAADSTDKKAISKACSDQANAKGLHGKERKKFRSECKHSGGKT
ncbi:MAG: PsiF family protein [Xanthobacteraceae bacterium]